MSKVGKSLKKLNYFSNYYKYTPKSQEKQGEIENN